MSKLCEKCILYKKCIDASVNCKIERCKNFVKQNDWVSVKERLPETIGSYLGYNKEYGAPISVYFNGKKFRFYDSEERSTVYITHWRPLPEIPKE